MTVRARRASAPGAAMRRPARFRETAVDYVQIAVGSVLVALATNLFLVPNNVVSGGITGVAIIGHTLLRSPVGAGVFVLNIPLLWLGWRYAGGGRFIVRTAVAVTILSAAIDATAPFLRPPTHDRLLVICYGGLLDGLGSGLVFRGRGTTGGTDIFARLARRRLGMPMGTSLLLMNVVIFAAAGRVYGLEPVMIALALSFVSARVVDLVQEGLSTARAALIVSAKPDEVREAVIQRLDRGVTILHGEGGYSGESRPVLHVVVAAAEVVRLKRILAEVDRTAFVTITPAKEVLGEGFSPNRPGDA
jgi:uncharacterized membrane-anchored protein YitT (DUF2179 family)